MQRIIDKCEEILSRFDTKTGRIGVNWHTMTTDDFVMLVKCVKEMAQTLQREGEEID